MNTQNRMKQVGAWAKLMRMVVKRLISSTALMLMLIVAGTAQGATWIGAAGATNAWETAGNWSPSGAPAGVYVLINNGGTARITTTIVTNSYVTIGSSVGSGYVIQDGGSLTLTNAATSSYIGNAGAGGYTLNTGTLTVKGPSATTPVLYVGYATNGKGTLNVGTGCIVAVGGDLRVGAGGSTSSRGTGTAVVNGGTLTVSGANFYNSVYGTGSLIVSNNGTVNAGALWTTYYSGDVGTITVASGGTLNVANSLRVGQAGTGEMTINGGTVNVTGGQFLGASWNAGSTGIITIINGTLNADASVSERIGQTGYGQMIMNGGTNNANGGIVVGVNAGSVGNLIISNGLVNTPQVFLTLGFGGATSQTGQVFLAGGTLATTNVLGNAAVGRESNFLFDGGTLRATANSAIFMQNNLTSAAITTNGAVIDDGGYAVTIAQVLKDAPGQIGKLTKKGAGTLTLSATNTFSGDVTVVAGTLALNQMLSTNVSVTIATGATNNLAFTGTNTIRMLSVNGELLQPNRVYGANNNGGARNLSPALSGGGYYYTTEGAPPKGTMVRFL